MECGDDDDDENVGVGDGGDDDVEEEDVGGSVRNSDSTTYEFRLPCIYYFRPHKESVLYELRDNRKLKILHVGLLSPRHTYKETTHIHFRNNFCVIQPNENVFFLVTHSHTFF